MGLELRLTCGTPPDLLAQSHAPTSPPRVSAPPAGLCNPWTETHLSVLEEKFQSFVSRSDIGIILINQHVSRGVQTSWIDCFAAAPHTRSDTPRARPCAPGTHPQVANDIRHLINAHKKAVPTVCEIPSKDAPYDASKDALMARVLKLLGGES